MAVTVYTTPTCPWCRKTKEFLEEEGVEFEERDVADDEDAAEEMIEISGQRGVPVTVVDGEEREVVVGFDPDTLREVLDL